MNDIKERLRKAVETAEVALQGGQAVRVRGMTGGERAEFAARWGDTDPDDVEPGHATDMAVWLALHCLVDDDGARALTDEDEDAVRDMSAASLDRITAAITGLSGVSEESVKEGKDGSAASDSGGAGSPSSSATVA